MKKLLIILIISNFIISCENNNVNQFKKVVYKDNEIEISLNKEKFKLGDEGKVSVKIGESGFDLLGHYKFGGIIQAEVQSLDILIEEESLVNYYRNKSKWGNNISSKEHGTKESFDIIIPDNLTSDTINFNVRLKYHVATMTKKGYKNFRNRSGIIDYTKKFILYKDSIFPIYNINDELYFKRKAAIMYNIKSKNIKEAIKEIEDTNNLIDIAINDEDWQIRVSSIRKITNESNAENAILKLRNQDLLKSFVLRANTPRLQNIAIRRLDEKINKEFLDGIASNTSYSSSTRIAAIERISNKAILVKIENNENVISVRKAATKRLLELKN